MDTLRSGLSILLLAASILSASPAHAESWPRPPGVGLEFQAYPAGLVPGIRWERPVRGDWALALRLGWNLTDRRDWGEHDDESGDGPGGGLSVLRHFEGWGRSWRAGVRVDTWWLEIDWEDDAASTLGAREGRTEVVVVQPTVVLGVKLWSSGPWTAEVTVAFGQEINVETDGEEVGEGLIGLLGITFMR